MNISPVHMNPYNKGLIFPSHGNNKGILDLDLVRHDELEPSRQRQAGVAQRRRQSRGTHDSVEGHQLCSPGFVFQ